MAFLQGDSHEFSVQKLPWKDTPDDVAEEMRFVVVVIPLVLGGGASALRLASHLREGLSTRSPWWMPFYQAEGKAEVPALMEQITRYLAMVFTRNPLGQSFALPVILWVKTAELLIGRTPKGAGAEMPKEDTAVGAPGAMGSRSIEQLAEALSQSEPAEALTEAEGRGPRVTTDVSMALAAKGAPTPELFSAFVEAVLPGDVSPGAVQAALYVQGLRYHSALEGGVPPLDVGAKQRRGGLAPLSQPEQILRSLAREQRHLAYLAPWQRARTGPLSVAKNADEPRGFRNVSARSCKAKAAESDVPCAPPTGRNPVVAQRRQGLFKHLAPMTWAEAQQQDRAKRCWHPAMGTAAVQDGYVPMLHAAAHGVAQQRRDKEYFKRSVRDQKKYEHDHEIAALKMAQPDEGDPHAPAMRKASKEKTALSREKILSVEKNDQNRSLKTGRLFPVPNKPDPMPQLGPQRRQNLAFLFTKITPEQMVYMWNVLTAIFTLQCLMIVSYCIALATFPEHYWTCTLCFGIPFAYICIQQIYIDHDVMHGVTFPPYEIQKYMTHPFSDFMSLPWEEFVLEHARHHASTVDLLIQGEFGWDPEEFHYALQQWAGEMGPNWYKLLGSPKVRGYLLTVPWIPVIHFFGLNDTGALFAIEWWMSFPEEGAGGEVSSHFWSKWFPRRVKHNAVVWFLWSCVWLLGTWPLGRPLSEGWRFVLPVTCSARVGFSLAWMFITNFTHSLPLGATRCGNRPWNKFLASDPGRNRPILHNLMALAVGGKHRWNEMLPFHDVHHAFPNALGTLSQRGRFHGWKKVHDASVEVLYRGLWKPNGDEETEMQKQQKKRSLLMREGK
eukprot:Skav219952  [mRNA]  locus=scaffold2879:169258:201031:+ [translate_table: standard]